MQLLGQRRVGDHVDAADEGRPGVGMTRVVSMPAVVVLPAPLGPSSPKISPRVHDQVQVVDGLEVGAGVDLGQADGADDRLPGGGRISRRQLACRHG